MALQNGNVEVSDEDRINFEKVTEVLKQTVVSINTVDSRI